MSPASRIAQEAPNKSHSRTKLVTTTADSPSAFAKRYCLVIAETLQCLPAFRRGNNFGAELQVLGWSVNRSARVTEDLDPKGQAISSHNKDL